MNKFTDETPIAMLTVGQLKEILGIDRILGNLTANQAPSEQVMTIEEVVRLTGYSKATIYKFTSDRKIPFRKPEHGGRRLYFQREEILDWLQSESHPTIGQENIKKQRPSPHSTRRFRPVKGSSSTVPFMKRWPR